MPIKVTRTLILSQPAVSTALAIAFVLVCGSALLSALSTRGLTASDQRIAHTHQTLIATSQLLATGSDIRVVPIRELDWTGASDHAFGNALNWNDVTDALNPAASAPDEPDFASITNAGSVTAASLK